MIDPNSYGYQDSMPDRTMETPIPSGEQTIGPGGYPSQYKFTPDEMRVLGECNRESFMQRSMPLATMGGLVTYLAIQKGHLRPNARFGPIPKVTLAVVAGYFIGKLSYQQACAEKLMALPGSYIGQLLRERRDGKTGGEPKQRQGPTMFGAKPSDIYSDAGPGSSLDLDTERPLFSDDAYRPTDSDGNKQAQPKADHGPAPRKPVSYDDLRRKNRGDYSDSKQDPYRTEQPVPKPWSPPVSTPTQTNKYGDVME